MTYADEFSPLEEGGEDSASPYPTMFGITFTPMIGGVLFAVLGLGGAIYLLLNYVLPAWDSYKQLEAKVTDKRSQIQQENQIKKKYEEANVKLAEAKRQKKDVLALFSNEKTLDTLLLDVNRFVDGTQGQLIRFQPNDQQAGNTANNDVKNVITDSSLGAEVNGKLKRKSFDVELEGTFDQIQSTMRSIERLPLLLSVKEFKAELGGTKPQKFMVDQQGKAVIVNQPTIRANFKLNALLPLTEQEAAAAQAAAAAQPKK